MAEMRQQDVDAVAKDAGRTPHQQFSTQSHTVGKNTILNFKSDLQKYSCVNEFNIKTSFNLPLFPSLQVPVCFSSFMQKP